MSSTLKTYHCNEWHNEYTEFYLKHEADKIIADKDKEIARLDDLAHAHNIELLRKENLIEELEKKHFNDLQDAEDSFKSNLELNRKEIRHQKYKRCLANAWWCLREEFFAEDCHCERWVDWAIKWYKRWMKLANHFKEML